jgi:hypothetical protein
MCHDLGKLFGRYVSVSRQKDAVQRSYRVHIPDIYHQHWRYNSIEITLYYGKKSWVATFPYSRWARRKSLTFRCDENGVPLEYGYNRKYLEAKPHRDFIAI